MRIVFTAYAILSALVSLVLTTSLMICDEFSEQFDRLVNLVISFMYLAFGPALFTFCLCGVTDLGSLAKQCLPGGQVGSRINTVDPVILMMATVLSMFVLCCFGLKVTKSMAEDDLNNEGSAFF